MASMLATRMTEVVGCSVPIQQAPMGPVASPELVVAVANAGGVGTLTALGRPVDELAATLDDIRAQTDGAIAANCLTDQMDLAAVEAASERVRVVDFFWSRPNEKAVAIAHAGGALACWQVGSVDDAKAAADAGCDLIVAQGVEAGGHVAGVAPLLPLLGGVLDAVSVPVLASGGISTPRAFAAVLAAGAAGARIGTRFIATDESGAHDDFKRAVIETRSGGTEITPEYSVMCPLCAQLPRVRVLSSALAAARACPDDTVGEADFGGQRVPLPKFAGLPPYRGVTGHVEAMALYAGESVEGVTDVLPAAQVISELVDGAQRLLKGW